MNEIDLYILIGMMIFLSILAGVINTKLFFLSFVMIALGIFITCSNLYLKNMMDYETIRFGDPNPIVEMYVGDKKTILIAPPKGVEFISNEYTWKSAADFYTVTLDKNEAIIEALKPGIRSATIVNKSWDYPLSVMIQISSKPQE